MVLRYRTLRHDYSSGLFVVKEAYSTVVSVRRCRVTSIDNTIQGSCLDHIDARGDQTCIWSKGSYIQGNYCVKTCKLSALHLPRSDPRAFGREGSKELKIRATFKCAGKRRTGDRPDKEVSKMLKFEMSS